MAKPHHNRRRQIVINKPVQKRIVVGITLIPMLTLVGATLAVAVLTGQVLDEARRAEENIPTLGPLFISLFLFIVAAGAVVVIQALRYSHRIAGPMYRINKSIERIREGDLAFEVKLRDGDELGEIATELNGLMDWLRAHPPQGVELKLEADEADEAQAAQATSKSDVDAVPGLSGSKSAEKSSVASTTSGDDAAAE